MLITVSRYAKQTTKRLAFKAFNIRGYEVRLRAKKTLSSLFDYALARGHVGVGVLTDGRELRVFEWNTQWSLFGVFRVNTVSRYRKEVVVDSFQGFRPFLPNTLFEGDEVLVANDRGLWVGERMLVGWSALFF
jgi:hypothetical protein